MTGGLKGEINWEVAINIYTLLGFPGGSAGKESACNAGGLGSIPGLGRSLEKGMATSQVFLHGEFHGQRSLESCSPRGRQESDTTE